MTSRRLSPRFVIAMLPALAGCIMAVPPNNSTDLGRVYYACDFAVVERVMDLPGVFDQIQQRERQRTECIRAGGPVAAAPSAATIVTLTPPVPEATAPPGSTILPPPEPTPGVGSISRSARQPRTPAAPTSVVPPPPLPGN
ncbi:MAG: hypothetical protein JNL66_01390 [Alphaproteobacteria bacterium]|nr:hypothetical protein [Alphaproteobacteria bacterium]